MLARPVRQEALAPGQTLQQRLPHRELGLVGERRREPAEVDRRTPPGDHGRPRVVHQLRALIGRERAQVRREPSEQLVVVLDADERVHAGVHDDRTVTGDLDRRAAGLDQHGFGPLGRPHEEWHVPHRVVLLSRDEVAPLPQLDLAVPQPSRDQRVPALPDPAVHDPADRLARGLFDRVPQVVRLGVAEPVLVQVPADPIAETFLTQVLLEHPQHRRALRVRQDVEHPGRVVGRAHGVLDRPRALERVHLERDRARAKELAPPLPVGAVRVHRCQAG